jgi:hypothetical protein
MADRFKIGNGVEILSLAKRTAQVNFAARFGASYSVREPSAEVLAAMAARASLAAGGDAGSLAPTTFDQINPKDTDYIYPLFRALSATLLSGVWIDFSKEGVLKEAVPLYLGQTVYTDHGRRQLLWGRDVSVNDWVGAISSAVWDEKGEQTAGIPGINVEMKIDWTMDVKLARGLLMKPPAIHSTSSTIKFSWDASHPDLLEQRRFFDLLGEEVEGEIVRLVVTKVLKIYEQSLVWEGQDQIAKQLPDQGDDEENLSARGASTQLSRGAAPTALPANKKETTKVKFTAQIITALAALGITGFAEAEEPAEDRIQRLIGDLAQRASSADQIVADARAECLRVATLAEGFPGADGVAGAVPEAIATMIGKAGPAEIAGLSTLYSERAAAKFPLTCQKCHSTEVAGRSSVENAPLVGAEAADDVQRSRLL